MSEITYQESINQGLEAILNNNPRSFLMGEDIAKHGGAFSVTKGLWEKFGSDRVMNMPISENSIVGAAIGASLLGFKPIVEIMFMDFVTLAMDQIINHAAKLSYISGGQYNVPIIIRTPQGGGGRKGTAANHTQSLESLFMNIPGLKILFPSNSYDAKGLLMSAAKEENPVIFIEQKNLYNQKSFVRDEYYEVPIGKAKIIKEGRDLTIISVGKAVRDIINICKNIKDIDMEIIDLVTMKPMDEQTILNSVKKTNKALIIQEAPKICGFAAEISAILNENIFDHLDSPVKRICGKDYPIPYNSNQELRVFPSDEDIIEGIYSFFK